MNTTTTKTCSKCGAAKPRTDFGPRAGMPDGLRGECRPCRRAKQREWARANEDRLLADGRARTARYRARHPERSRASAAASKARYPSHWRANNKVNRAIEAGRMVPAHHLMCVDCGNQARDYDHFLGYDPAHWLHVQPVCRRCHGRRGRKHK